MIAVLGLVTYRIYPTLMGGQKGVALFYDALQQYVAVYMALSKNNELAETATKKKTLYTNRLLPLNFFCIGGLKELARQQQTQLILAEHSYAGWIALLLKKRTGLPFVIHSHNLEAQRFKHMRRRWWRLYERYEKWIHQKADFNFFISNEDKAFAVKHFHLDAAKCETITYGVQPFKAKSQNERITFLQSAGIHTSVPVLLFNGTLDYQPNIEAVYNLAEEVAPRLHAAGQLFQILISGNRASTKLKAFIHRQPYFTYLDYVPDVSLVYQSAQLFLNPILNNTGVKTKVLEAIANQCTVVSTASGAAGIESDVCGKKLIVAADSNWNSFADTIKQQLQKTNGQTPPLFFDSYLWSNIAQKAAAALTTVVLRNA